MAKKVEPEALYNICYLGMYLA